MLTIEKDDIKDIGVQPMGRRNTGRRIELMAKIKEITSTQRNEHPGGVESKLENSSPKRKITTLDKKKLGCQSKDTVLRKVSVILRINLIQCK